MGKTLRNRGMVTFYVRKEYKRIFEEFAILVNKDTRFRSLQHKKGDSLISIAIMQLINKYVKENHNPDIKVESSEEENELEEAEEEEQE
jgi:hypothetical protein